MQEADTRTSVRMAHSIELWETKGEKTTMVTTVCLACGWHEGDGTRAKAETEAGMHDRGERYPWQLAPGEAKPWRPGCPVGSESPPRT
jgi:hypothetical protein